MVSMMKDVRIRNLNLEEVLQLIMLWNKDTLMLIHRDGKPVGYVFITKHHFFYAYYDGEYGAQALDKLIQSQKELELEIHPDRDFKQADEHRTENLMDYLFSKLDAENLQDLKLGV